MWIYHQITQKHLFSFWNTITVVRPSLFWCVSMIYYTRIRNTNTLSCWTELGQRWFKTKTCFLKVIYKLSPEAEWIFCILNNFLHTLLKKDKLLNQENQQSLEKSVRQMQTVKLSIEGSRTFNIMTSI